MTIDWDDKYARDGLTFDDVLLVPAESRVLPSRDSVDNLQGNWGHRASASIACDQLDLPMLQGRKKRSAFTRGKLA